ncbi:hypothetical protein SDC9_113342 [bioreactor metagenome]|uniref:Uncharacterized protein n=1 Tax=bioreactor metagenome TaxID=1076179 RepID=A0A645BMF7_9ZZZZ
MLLQGFGASDAEVAVYLFEQGYVAQLFEFLRDRHAVHAEHVGDRLLAELLGDEDLPVVAGAVMLHKDLQQAAYLPFRGFLLPAAYLPHRGEKFPRHRFANVHHDIDIMFEGVLQRAFMNAHERRGHHRLEEDGTRLVDQHTFLEKDGIRLHEAVDALFAAKGQLVADDAPLLHEVAVFRHLVHPVEFVIPADPDHLAELLEPRDPLRQIV